MIIMPRKKILELPQERKTEVNAPIWKRIASFFVDLLIIQIVIFSPFSTIVQSKMPMSENFLENYETLKGMEIMDSMLPIFIAVFGLIFLYFTLFEYKLSQTPGKMLFNLYLRPLDNIFDNTLNEYNFSDNSTKILKKQKITLLSVIIRNIAAFPFFPFSLLWIIDPIYMIATGKRLSDVLSKTQIVEEVKI